MSIHGTDRSARAFSSKSRTKFSKKIGVALGALLLLAFSTGPQAAYVPLDEVAFITGTDISVFEFEITMAIPGGFTTTLTDFEFPEAFDALLMTITSATQTLGTLLAPGSFTFNADPGTYFASVIGVATGALNLGLAGIEVQAIGGPVTVPLPPAVWLMGVAVVALVTVRRREAE